MKTVYNVCNYVVSRIRLALSALSRYGCHVNGAKWKIKAKNNTHSEHIQSPIGIS